MSRTKGKRPPPPPPNRAEPPGRYHEGVEAGFLDAPVPANPKPYVPMGPEERRKLLDNTDWEDIDYDKVAAVCAETPYAKWMAAEVSQVRSISKSILALVTDVRPGGHPEACRSLLRILLDSAAYFAYVADGRLAVPFPKKNRKVLDAGRTRLKERFPDIQKIWGLASHYIHGSSNSAYYFLPATNRWGPKVEWDEEEYVSTLNMLQGTFNIVLDALGALLDQIEEEKSSPFSRPPEKNGGGRTPS